MSKTFLLINQKLDDLHYGALATMNSDPLLKSPLSLRQMWRQNPPDASALEAAIQWLTDQGEAEDFLVIEGDETAIQPVLDAARQLGLIAMRPVWQPVPAFVPLIAEDKN